MSLSSSSASSSSTYITINPQELQEIAIVHMPCLVSDDEKIVEMLGGAETIENTIKNKTELIQLKFPNTDALRHHLVGTREKCNAFVIKLTRNKSSSNNNNNSESSSVTDPYTVEVVGKTCYAYTFKSPSDYQFLAQSTEKFLTHANAEAMRHALEVIPRPIAKPLLATVSLPIFHDRKKFKKPQQDNFVAIPGRKVGEPLPPIPVFPAEVTVRTRLRNVQKKKEGAATLQRLFDAIPSKIPIVHIKHN